MGKVCLSGCGSYWESASWPCSLAYTSMFGEDARLRRLRYETAHHRRPARPPRRAEATESAGGEAFCSLKWRGRPLGAPLGKDTANLVYLPDNLRLRRSLRTLVGRGPAPGGDERYESKPFSRVHIICIENRTWRNFLSQRGTPRARRAAAANLRIRRSRAS